MLEIDAVLEGLEQYHDCPWHIEAPSLREYGADMHHHQRLNQSVLLSCISHSGNKVGIQITLNLAHYKAGNFPGDIVPHDEHWRRRLDVYVKINDRQIYNHTEFKVIDIQEPEILQTQDSALPITIWKELLQMLQTDFPLKDYVGDICSRFKSKISIMKDLMDTSNHMPKENQPDYIFTHDIPVMRPSIPLG